MPNLNPAPLALDPSADDLRPVAVLCQRLTGRRPSPATIWRWCSRGTRRAGRLPAVRVFGTWHSTSEALMAWLQNDSQQPSPAADDPAERSEATTRRLRAAGLIS